MIRFLVDEGCDSIVVRKLRSLGYDVIYVAEEEPGKSDDAILEWGNETSRVIVTEDTDFGELVFRHKKLTYGVILIRIPDKKRLEKADQITNLINTHADDLVQAMTTITLTNIRIRPLGIE